MIYERKLLFHIRIKIPVEDCLFILPGSLQKDFSVFQVTPKISYAQIRYLKQKRRACGCQQDGKSQAEKFCVARIVRGRTGFDGGSHRLQCGVTDGRMKTVSLSSVGYCLESSRATRFHQVQ